jgi:hypothetical protein
MSQLLTVGNPKTAKGEGLGYLTAILHLAPADTSSVMNVCPWATEGCKAACLNTAGRGGIFRKGETTNAIQEARKRRTEWFKRARGHFVATLAYEINRHAKRAAAHGLKPAIRLNGTSDIPWEKVAPFLFTQNPGVQFYDYTKSPERAAEQYSGKTWPIGGFRAVWPSNYHLTYSRNENTTDEAMRFMLRCGVSVAVPWGAPLLENDAWEATHRRWEPANVVDGDANDLRFLDPRGSVVLLKAKGRAKRDTTGFVLR